MVEAIGTAAPAATTSPPRRMIAGGATASAIAQAAGLASLGLASIVLGRALGAHGYGVYAVANTILLILATVMSIGLGNGIAFEMASGRWSPASALRHALPASILLGGVGAALGAVLYLVAGDELLPGVSTLAVAILLGSTPGWVALFLLIGASTALERYEAFGLLQFAHPFLIAVATSAAALAFELSAVVAAIGVATLLVGIGGSIWALRVARRFDRGSAARNGPVRLTEAARFGARTWAADLLVLLNLRAPLLLVGAIAGAGEAGLYGVAATLTTLGMILPHAVAWVLLPRVASLEEGERNSEMTVATIGRAGRQTAVLAVATSIALIGAILLVPTVYGSAFDGTVRLGLILVPGIAFFGLSRVLSYALAGLNEPGAVLRLSAGVVLPTLVVYTLVIPWGGAVAAAVVSSASLGAIVLLLVRAISRKTGIPAADLVVPRRDDLHAYRELAPVLMDYLRQMRHRPMAAGDRG
jgi:O-antigen/teichoic acid export membrane protein